MFSELLESTPRRQRSVGGTIASVIFHAVAIAATIFGTLHAKQVSEKPPADNVVFTEAPSSDSPPGQAPPANGTATSLPRTAIALLPPPIDIPGVLPDIDISATVTNEADFGGTTVAGAVAAGAVAAGAVAAGTVGGTAPATDRAYFEFQVEKQVIQAPGSPAPRYPRILSSGMVEGEVLVQFVVDTTGRAVPASFRVFSSTHELFTDAVRSALPRMRFLPAEIGGRKVRQLVQQRFAFATAR